MPRAGQPVEAAVVGQVLASGELLVQAGRLGQDAGDGADALRPLAQRVAVHGGLTIGGRDQAGQHADGGRLAGAVRARAGRRSRRPPPRTTGRARRSAAGSPCEARRRRSPARMLAGDAAPSPIGTFGCRGSIGPMAERTTEPAAARSSGKLTSRPRRRGRAWRTATPRRARWWSTPARSGSWPGTANGWPLVSQWRHAAGREMLEIPAGHAGPGRGAARHRRAGAGRGVRPGRRTAGRRGPPSSPRPASAPSG